MFFKGHCDATPSPNWPTAQYCKTVCSDCFCNGQGLLKTNCENVCNNVWYTVLPAVKLGANLATPLTDWHCNVPSGNTTEACSYACTCADAGPNCIDNCKQSAAAFFYNLFCVLPL